MELILGGLIAFAVEVLVIALLLDPGWTLRTLRRPFRPIGRRLRCTTGRRRRREATAT